MHLYKVVYLKTRLFFVFCVCLRLDCVIYSWWLALICWILFTCLLVVVFFLLGFGLLGLMCSCNLWKVHKWKDCLSPRQNGFILWMSLWSLILIIAFVYWFSIHLARKPNPTRPNRDPTNPTRFPKIWWKFEFTSMFAYCHLLLFRHFL